MSWHIKYPVFCTLLMLPLLVGATEVVISGKIVDRSGQPVPGVRFTAPSTTFSPARFPVPVPSSPTARTQIHLFRGVPAECLDFAPISTLRTDAGGEYRLLGVFEDERQVGIPIGKTCADYRSLLTEDNMTLVPDPADVQRYDLVRARGPLPLPTQRLNNGNAARQVAPATNPALRGGFVPGR